MSGPSIRWEILGTGLVAQQFAFDLTRIVGGRLAAVASRTPQRADWATGALGASAGCVGRDALLGRHDVDIVYVATPTRRHAEDCLAALGAGKAVLCEKPLASTEVEARAIAEAARAAGLFCMEALWTHFLPATQEAERRLLEGRIGRPRQLVASFGLPSPPPGAGRSDSVLLDRGCYPISLALRLFGSPVHAAGNVTDEAATATLAFADGRQATLLCSRGARLDNRLFVGGEAGWLSLEELVCPTVLRVGRCEAAASSQTDLAAPSLRESVRRAARRWPLLARARRLVGDKAEIWPCRGYGFSHEIEEVHACLAAGRIQSLVHPISRSLETLGIIDELAQGAGMGRRASHGSV